jgi:hypothetical protein
MNIEDIIGNVVARERAEEIKTSQQLILGELILKLEAIEDKHKPIIFDGGKYHPSCINSWRGSYEELAIEYEELGRPLSTKHLLILLRNAIGSIFYGYKGGEFKMGKTTPVWVANYGHSEGFREENGIYTQAVVDVSQNECSTTYSSRMFPAAHMTRSNATMPSCTSSLTGGNNAPKPSKQSATWHACNAMMPGQSVTPRTLNAMILRKSATLHKNCLRVRSHNSAKLTRNVPAACRCEKPLPTL